jgi:hypothetical protein
MHYIANHAEKDFLHGDNDIMDKEIDITPMQMIDLRKN